MLRMDAPGESATGGRGALRALIRFCDGAAEPPQRHRRKHATWRSSNGTGRLVRKAPQRDALPASFTLHVGDFGSDDVTVVKAYRVFAVTGDEPLAPGSDGRLVAGREHLHPYALTPCHFRLLCCSISATKHDVRQIVSLREPLL
jgi:hypothetical protein